MRTRIFIFILFLPLMAPIVPCQAQENARKFITAMEAYKTGDYPSAIANMEAIAQHGIKSGELYYNLGNAYLKNNDLGPAILWYERALKLMPNDPDLRFNYDYARSLTKDAPEEDGASLVRILFFWKYQFSGRTITYLAVASNLSFWFLLLGYRFFRRRGFRHAAAVALIPTTIFVFTAIYNYYEDAHKNQGVVLNEKVSVRSGLDQTSTELFVLHAGAKVKVVKKMKDHLQIRFSKDKIGWVEKGSVGPI